MAVVRRAKVQALPPASPELAKSLAGIRKTFGDKAIRAGTSAIQPFRIPTGIFAFDLATLGGIPQGRVSMTHGPKHSGKSYMTSRIMMGAQQTMPDSKVACIETEGTYDAVWNEKIGVDNENLLLVQPDSGEEAVDIAVALAHTREVSLIVIDSLANLVPLKEQEASAEDALVALQAKMITSMLRKLTVAQITERKRGHIVTVHCTNQQRVKIGGWSPTGEPIGLPGGRALGHFTSLEWRAKNKENLKKGEDGEQLSHNDHAFTIEKNKCNAGFRSGEFRMLRRDDEELGLTEAEIDDAPIMLSHAKMQGIYEGGGKAGYTLTLDDYEPIHVANADEMVRYLYANKEILWSLRCQLIAYNARQQGMPEWFVNYIRTGDTSGAPNV